MIADMLRALSYCSLGGFLLKPCGRNERREMILVEGGRTVTIEDRQQHHIAVC